MNKVQFFYDDDLISLTVKINDWLATNREIKIIDSNISALGKPSLRAGITNTEKYVFFILYEINHKELTYRSEQAEEEIISSLQQIDTEVGTTKPN